MTELSVYDRLSAPFDHTFTDVRGGVSLEYVTGEQVVSRLNDVLGVTGWSFRILEHGINADADETWVLAELTASIDGQTIVRHQFGSDKIQRSRSTGSILDIGFDLKSAATDGLKKCASLLGVGLYLSRKKLTPQQVLAHARQEYGELQKQAKAVGIDAKNLRTDASLVDIERWMEALSQKLAGLVEEPKNGAVEQSG